MMATELEAKQTGIATVPMLMLGALSFVLALPMTTTADDDDQALSFSGDEIAFFETRIRPVLAEQCLSCHGAQKQTSGLRLDTREAILDGGFIEGPSVYLDEPGESPLLVVLRHETELAMPPDGKLDGAVIADFERWVGLGMPWPDDGMIPTPEDAADAVKTHWAFQPITDPEIPEVEGTITSVDAFILNHLTAEGIEPSPMADRRTLIRRVTFDLIGLPPSPEEVDAFLNDPNSDDEAFAEVVDRLLASPHYGERWGRHWLDVARYADTKGYVFTEERRYPYAYTYRDYVVRAFNDDKPFDRFIVEQLAADQLDLAESDPDLAAMGFLTVGQRFLNNKHDMIDDRIDVVTRGLMGLTVTCARCHDHKYDPIPTADYYALHGVFDSSNEPESLPLITELDDANGPERDDFRKQLADREAEVTSYLRSKRDEINAEYRDKLPAYLAAAQAVDFKPGGGDRSSPEATAIDNEARAREISAKRLATFIRKWNALTSQAGGESDPIVAPWLALARLPAESFAEQAPEVVNALAENPDHPAHPVVVAALLEPSAPATFAEVVDRYALALSIRSTDEDDTDRTAIDALFTPESGPLSVADGEMIRILERDERDHHRNLERRTAELQVSHAGAPPRAMVMVDSETPVEPAIFVRGNPGNPGPTVPRQFLKLIEGEARQPFVRGSGRLELAQKIADPSNPLTSRVMVNRLWMHHFGQPIVGTPSDFGTRSDLPSHPELLDHLASRFTDSGWSVKAMHRLIVNSRTYRQVSADRDDARAIDSENVLLWRQNRRRLELEPMRDAMLSVSGRLEPRFGGRPGSPPSAPEGTRRTLYSMIDRTFLDGVYRTFDFASTEVSNPDRPTTIVPQQALFLMNSPFVSEQARMLADRVREETPDAPTEARIQHLYHLLFGRPAEPAEVAIGQRFLESQVERTEAPSNPWHYGFGGFDVETEQVTDYQAFPHFSGDSWQFGAEYPHPEGQYLRLNAAGGHVGHGQEAAAIRRWRSPVSGVIRIEGRLNHKTTEGDGVRGRIVASSGGLLGEWVTHGKRARTIVDAYEVSEGETIDFVVDCIETPNHDSFDWAPVIRFEDAENDRAESWEARSQFAGPPSPPPSPDQQYAQALLMTNEFLFID